MSHDVLQDTYVGVWRGAKNWREEGEVAAWIWGIGLRRLISRLRGSAAATPTPAAEIDAASDHDVSAEDAVLLGVEHGDLATALNRLSPEPAPRRTGNLLDGLTTKEAAKLLSLPQGTVKSRIRKAKELLRTDLAAPILESGRPW